MDGNPGAVVRAARAQAVAVALVLAVVVGAGARAVPAAAQDQAVLVIRAQVPDGSGRPAPLARLALLISDSPATRAPRRVVTGADGTVTVRLRPGNYTVESDVPIAVAGVGYQWTETLDVRAGSPVSLDLTDRNAEVVSAAEIAAAPERAEDALARRLPAWEPAVVAVWTPTARLSGTLVDPRGIILTAERGVADARAVGVQVGRTKVPALVLAADAQRGVAVLHVDASALPGVQPATFDCAQPTPLAPGDRVATLGVPLRGPTTLDDGQVDRDAAGALVAEMTIAPGGVGGPLFAAAGALAGMTAPLDTDAGRQRRRVRVVPIEAACAVLAEARTALTSAPAPSSARLPIEPERPFPKAALEADTTPVAQRRPPAGLTAAAFTVTFLTPVSIDAARRQAESGRTTSRSLNPRQPRGVDVFDFGRWSEYFDDPPAALVLRLTPRLEEGFWQKVARGAAYTQGMALPPLGRFTAAFAHLRLFCGDTEVPPIQPFVLDQRVSPTEAVREGLYVFDPGAVGPHCPSVSLRLMSEKEPGKEDRRVVDPAIVTRVWDEFAPWRAAGASSDRP